MNTEDSEFQRIEREQAMRGVPDPIHHTDPGETLEYITGWNDCRAAMLEQHPSTVENNGGKTGWPPGLLQDDCKGLSKWLSKQPDARRRVREALVEQPAQQEPVAWEYGDEIFWHDAPDLNNHIRATGKPLVYGDTSPQAQPAREPLTDEQIADYLGDEYHIMTEEELRFFKLGEQAAHGITKGNK